MGRPGQECRNAQRNEGFAPNGAENDPHGGSLAQRRRCYAQFLKGEEQKTKADYRAGSACCVLTAAVKHESAGDENRPKPFDIESKELRRERRTHVRAKHHGQSG
jgi:hypothetical protein